MARSVGKTTQEPQAENAVEAASVVQDEELLEFLRAIDDYRRKNSRPFPTWSEVLLILHSLGYKKDPAPRSERSEG